MVILLAHSDNVVVFGEVPSLQHITRGDGRKIVHKGSGVCVFVSAVLLLHHPHPIISLTNLFGLHPQIPQAYTFVELFAGAAWVSRCMRTGGHRTASMDILMGQAEQGKQNYFDLLTDSGFLFLGISLFGSVDIEKESFDWRDAVPKMISHGALVVWS